MKFLTRINRNYLILFSITLMGVTIGGYFILHLIILRGSEENLLSKEYLIEKQIRDTGTLPNFLPLIEVTKTDERTLVKPSFNEVIIYNELEKENEVFLEYSNTIVINNIYYLIKIRQFSFEHEDLVLALAMTLFILLLFAFIISYLITKIMNRIVWADFEHNLKVIENFSFRINKGISLKHSDTEEFERLNKVITDFTDKLKSDYTLLKEFTENASHEIQTPLSIVLLNLEEILQEDLKEETFRKVASSISAVKKLSTLNNSLILLTKLENRQFNPDNAISFKELISQKIQEFSILFESKKLEITLKIEQDFVHGINEQLAGILINNLFSNAANHNFLNGSIHIFINREYLKICNSGEENSLTDNDIFNRFSRGNSKSFGLGLAIAKKICETSNLDIRYIKSELHCFIIQPQI